MHTKNSAQNLLYATKQAVSRDCGYSNKALGVTQAITLAVTRDSIALDRSNWSVIVADMTNQFGTEDGQNDDSSYENVSNWHIERFSHWACGWIDYLVVNVWTFDREDMDYQADPSDLSSAQVFFSPAFDAMQDWLERLEDYPIASEDHFSRLESEELDSYLTDVIESMRRRFQLTSRAPKSTDFIIWKLQQTRAFQNVGSLDDLRGDKEILAGLQSLGYAYKRL